MIDDVGTAESVGTLSHRLAETERKLEAAIAQLGALADRMAIQDLLNAYCRGSDRADLAVMKALYHPGCIDEHGIFTGSGEAFAEMLVPWLRANYRMMQHHHSTTSFDISGDAAGVETYFLCVMETAQGDLEFSSGRAADTLEKRDGRWGFVHRKIIMDWTIEAPKPTPIKSAGQFPTSGYGADDPSYQALPTLRDTVFR